MNQPFSLPFSLPFAATGLRQAFAALVVGNAAYTNAPLRNPVNDAQDMAAKLQAPGDDLMRRFDELDNPRQQTGRFQFPLQELLLTALCAVAAGAQDWVEVRA